MNYRQDIVASANRQLPWSHLEGKNILVTGSTGLIGSTIVDILMSRSDINYNVYASGRSRDRFETLFSKYRDNGNLHFVEYDVIRPLATDIDYHYIIHAASGANPKAFATIPVEVMQANIQGTVNLLDYGYRHNLKRFVFVSSGEIYGEGDGREFSEDYSGYVNCATVRACYPSSKRAAETICMSYISEYGLEACIARPCHIYGPNFTNQDNRVYAQFIRNVLHGEDIVMKSSGEQFRSWCYVVDCANALLTILLKGENGEAYNIADPESNISIRELAETIAHLGSKKVIINIPDVDEKKGFNVVKKSVFSTVKLEKLGWHAETHITEGLEKTIQELKERSI